MPIQLASLSSIHAVSFSEGSTMAYSCAQFISNTRRISIQLNCLPKEERINIWEENHQ